MVICVKVKVGVARGASSLARRKPMGNAVESQLRRDAPARASDRAVQTTEPRGVRRLLGLDRGCAAPWPAEYLHATRLCKFDMCTY